MSWTFCICKIFTQFHLFLTTLMTNDNNLKDNVDDKYRNIYENDEVDSNSIKQKQWGCDIWLMKINIIEQVKSI